MGSGRDFWFSRPWRAWRPRPAVARSKPPRPGFSRRHSDGAGAGETRWAGFRAPKNRPGEHADSPGWAPRERRRSGSMAVRVGRAAKPGRAAFGPGRLSAPARRLDASAAQAAAAARGALGRFRPLSACPTESGNGPVVRGMKFSVRPLKATRSAPATIPPQELADPRLPPGGLRSLSASSDGKLIYADISARRATDEPTTEPLEPPPEALKVALGAERLARSSPLRLIAQTPAGALSGQRCEGEGTGAAEGHPAG